MKRNTPIFKPELSEQLIKFAQLIPGFNTAEACYSFFTWMKSEIFYSRLKHFYDAVNLDENEFRNYFNTLNSEETELISVYLFEKLFSADEIEKSYLYGLIYKHAVLNKTPPIQVMRLCKAIENTFIEDLKYLGMYAKSTTDSSHRGVSLLNVGLLINKGFDGGLISDPYSGGTVFQLSNLGKQLYQILESNHWKHLQTNTPSGKSM